MTNEFKKINQGNITRYVLENASGGGTSSGSVASVSMPMGGMQRRKGDNLIAQESDKKKVPATTPRNFVAKNAKSSGAGAHKDKKKAAKQGQEKHKKPFMEDHSTASGGWGQGSYDTYSGGNHGRGVAENPEWYSDEANGMSSSQLKSLYKHAMKLRQAVQQMQAQGDTLEPWQQSKVTKAADYLDAVFNAVDDEHDMGESNHPDEKEDTALIRKMVKQQALKQERLTKEGDAGLSKDAETNFHAKLDQLVHATFGKRKEEQGVAEGSLNELSKDTLKSYSNERGATIHADQRDAGGARIMAADKKKHGDTKASADWDDEASWLDKRAEKGAKGVAQATTKIAKKGVAEGAKVDRQAKHITASMMKKGKSKKDAESIAWAHIKHPKNESADSYFESLSQMVERQLEPTMDLDAWVDNFQNADPNKYHQFKNKTPEKKK